MSVAGWRLLLGCERVLVPLVVGLPGNTLLASVREAFLVLRFAWNLLLACVREAL